MVEGLHKLHLEGEQGYDYYYYYYSYVLLSVLLLVVVSMVEGLHS